MKISIVLGCVNNNSKYYSFIPDQIYFWNKFGIKFITVFVGECIPDELKKFEDQIILWNLTPELNSAYVAQNLRLYYPALIPVESDDCLVMITDMDMLPTNDVYYTKGIEHFTKKDFIYYRELYMSREIYMCYNAAHPDTWGEIFKINTMQDIAKKLRDNSTFDAGIIGTDGWSIDQCLMYNNVMNYPHRQILNRPIKRIESWDYYKQMQLGNTDFIKNYDDMHMHRSYQTNVKYILDAREQINRRFSSIPNSIVVPVSRNKLFITFGGPTDNYHTRVSKVCAEAKSMNYFTRIVGVTDRFLKKDINYWNLHGEFIENSRRGYGNCIWKPYIIKTFLDKLNENDLLVYVDSGCTVNNAAMNRLLEYVDMVDKSPFGMVSHQMNHLPEIKYCKKKLIEYLSPDVSMLESGQFVAGIQFMRKNAHTTHIVNEWYRISCMHELIDDVIEPNQDPRFVDHRHDQSIYSLLVKKYGTVSIPDETYFEDWKLGMKSPFLATRIRS